ncbi:GntR family transcriptional regulator [Mesorhizobium sp. ANAO-SY3R2]|uniref:GntR family transcriptional regulator n=1 Tax=Mesorhizobium sp. ANAO-SY3R2 TaxID=3166644 RepID=UPI00366F38F3
MLREVRFRICSLDPQTPLMLHEGKLAQEFGVSRTPIRQVLQRLAFEGLLETRSGVGTIASPLDVDQRALHFSVLADMFRLCAGCCAQTFDITARSHLATIAVLSKAAGDQPLAAFYHIRSEILALVSGLVSDTIAADAQAAMHWRALRWRLAAARADIVASLAAVRTTITGLAAAETPPELLAMLANEPLPGAVTE